MAIAFVNDVHLTDFQVRAPTLEDAAALADMVNTCQIADVGTCATVAEEVQNNWSTPGLDLVKDARLVVTPGGQIVGYICVKNYQEWHVSPRLEWEIHPDYRVAEIADFLFDFAEARARERIPEAPADARVVLHNVVDDRNSYGNELLERLGYQQARRYYDMLTELTEPPLATQVPAGISIKPIGAGQERACFEAIEDAFVDHWSHTPMAYELWQHFVNDSFHADRSLWFMAMDGDQIAGFALCLPRTIHDPDMAWVDDLGVRRAWRRRGLGLALLHYAFGEFYRRGIHKVGLGVDASSLTNALALYQRAGMHVDKQFNRYEKELRPGRELRTISV